MPLNHPTMDAPPLRILTPTTAPDAEAPPSPPGLDLGTVAALLQALNQQAGPQDSCRITLNTPGLHLDLCIGQSAAQSVGPAVVPPIVKPTGPTHTDDFRRITWPGSPAGEYIFTPNQARIVAVLWERYRTGDGWASTLECMRAADCQAQKMADVFRKCKAWEDGMIEREEGAQGLYRMHPFQPTPNADGAMSVTGALTPIPTQDQPQSTSDFRLITWPGSPAGEYIFTTTQARIIALLWERYFEGTIWASHGECMKAANCQTAKISDLFKESKAWHDGVIERGSTANRGLYRLRPLTTTRSSEPVATRTTHNSDFQLEEAEHKPSAGSVAPGEPEDAPPESTEPTTKPATRTNAALPTAVVAVFGEFPEQPLSTMVVQAALRARGLRFGNGDVERVLDELEKSNRVVWKQDTEGKGFVLVEA